MDREEKRQVFSSALVIVPAPVPIFASVPSKRLERASLLADSDGATGGHAGSV